MSEAIVGRVVVAGSTSNDSSAARPEARPRKVEVRVIQTVQGIETDLEIAGFTRQRYSEVLAKREIDVLNSRALENIAARVSIMAWSWNGPSRIGAADREIRAIKQCCTGVVPTAYRLIGDMRVSDHVWEDRTAG